MAKDAYYFPHDANARHDPDICHMRSIYGIQGYGWFWVLVEILREQDDYKLKLCKCNAYAMQMQCEENAAEKFIKDCINTFDLFESDGTYFWSPSLIRRMQKFNEKSEKARQAALTRWTSGSNANAMRTQCERNASKVNKSKVNKNIYSDNVAMTEEEYQKLIEQFGQSGTDDRIERLNLYKGSTGKKYKNDYLTILNWERKKQDKPNNKDQPIYPKQNLEEDPEYIEFLKRGGTG